MFLEDMVLTKANLSHGLPMYGSGWLKLRGCSIEDLSLLLSFQMSAHQLGFGELKDGVSPLHRKKVRSGPGQERLGYAVCNGWNWYLGSKMPRTWSVTV